MNMSRIRGILNGGLRDWSLNANEVSGWVRLAAPVLLWVGALRRSFRQLLSVLAFVAVSPYLFAASSEDTWMNRAMRGEQVWMLRGRLDISRVLSLAGMGSVGLAVLLGLFRKFWVSLLLLVNGSILTAWHFDRMAELFEQERDLENLQADEEESIVP